MLATPLVVRCNLFVHYVHMPGMLFQLVNRKYMGLTGRYLSVYLSCGYCGKSTEFISVCSETHSCLFYYRCSQRDKNDPRATGKCPSRQSATACYHLQLTVFWVNSSKCKWNQTLHIFSDADGYTQVPSCTVCHFKSQTSRKKGCAAFLVKTEVTGNMNHSAVLSSWKGSISIRYTLKTQS